MTVCIAGWGHTNFGKLENEDVESLMIQAVRGAIQHAEIDPRDIDAGFVGFYNGGLSEQDFISSLVMHAEPQLRFKPITRVENACATGSAAIYQGIHAIKSGRAKVVLVVGVEKMTHLSSEAIGKILLQASYLKEESDIQGGFTGVFARIAQNYFQRYGDQSDALARIAAKNHANGCKNPYAHLKKDLGYEFCRTESEKNPFVVSPLKRTDCSLISDGAAALILVDGETALGTKRAVAFRAYQQVNDFLPLSRRDMTFFEGATKAWGQAYAQAKVGVDDLDFAETHDCFTIAELMHYEAMGLTERGQGAKAILEGWTARDGKLPINLSGGLKSKGHPIGATGLSMHIMASMQLTGTAGDMQIASPELGAVYNMGGAGVANYVSILERMR